MSWKKYLDQVKTDAIECIDENYNYCDDWEKMYDMLFLDDSVTGNGSGSYTFSKYEAENNIKGIIFDDDVIEAFNELGYDLIPLQLGAEACDVIARCIALDRVSPDLEEYFNNIKR